MEKGTQGRTLTLEKDLALALSLGGVVPGVDLDKALRLAEALEDESIARKLEMRK